LKSVLAVRGKGVKIALAIAQGQVVMAARLFNELSLFQVEDAAGSRRGARIVRHQKNGLLELLLKLAEQVQDFFGTLGVQVARGFVRHDQGRVGDDGPCDAHALLLATGELPGPVPGPIGDAHELQRQIYLSASLGARHW
jgi:hypothetical protein